MLDKELDIIKLLQSVSQSKLLLKGMLSRRQQILINFQRSHVIETTVTGDSTEENLEEMFMNYMKSKNPLDRLFAVSKANRLLKAYVGDNFADPVDAKLVMGLYHRNTDLNDFMKRQNPNQQENIKRLSSSRRVSLSHLSHRLDSGSKV